MIVTHTLDTDASKEAFLAARTALRHYATAAGTVAAEIGGEEGAEAAAIADALRSDSLSNLTGRAPAAPVRHLPSLSRSVRRIVEEIHGSDPGAFCPVLAADGVLPTEAQAERVRNGRSNLEIRATTERCPLCLAADVVRTLRRDGAAARDADARWNRRGS
jgi:hypothetical protein